MNAGTNASVLVLGAPFDRVPQNQRGCAEGPNTLRVAGLNLGLSQGFLFLQKDRRKALSQLSVSDAGNVETSSHETSADYLDRLSRVISRVAVAKKIPLILGGDHLVTLAILRGLCEYHKAIQVVHLDAHSDVQTVSSSSFPTNANFVSFAANISGITSWFQVGVRAPARHVPDFPPNVIGVTAHQLIHKLERHKPVYLSIDTDGFDPSIMPAVTYPVPRGLSFDCFDEVLNALRTSSCPVAGVDWVEFNPELDFRPGMTAWAILTGLVSVLELLEHDQLRRR